MTARSPIQQALDERIQNWTQQQNSASCQLQFDESFPGFQGHFPGNPIIPGVCFTALLPVLGERLLGKSCTIQAISREKFMRPIRPGDCCDVHLTLVPADPQRFRAELAATCGNEPVCKIKATIA